MADTEKHYSVHELARLSGISVRTLHYYDELGLLRPERQANNYRSYSPQEVNRLQQILLYRETGMSLGVIKEILDDPAFDVWRALNDHLKVLQAHKARYENLIASVEKTLAAQEGKIVMEDGEKFESFKKQLIEENEAKYGTEVRERFGDDALDASNAKVMGLSVEHYQQAQEIDKEYKELLAIGMEKGDPSCEEAQQACDLHRKWLMMFWKEDAYSKEAHRGLGDMYATDDRFKAHYDAVKPGMAEFFREALRIYTKS